MAKLPIQSAKFKKDVVVYFAIVLFFVIVSAELFLAGWLPWHLRIDSMWAEQVARRELIEEFDRLRSLARRNADKLPAPAAAEAALMLKSLDRLPRYFNLYGNRMSPEQCKLCLDSLLRLRRYLSMLNERHAFSAELPLEQTQFVKKLRGRTP